MAEPVTQNALGTFLATFVFALTALLLFGVDAVAGPRVTLTFLCTLVLALNAGGPGDERRAHNLTVVASGSTGTLAPGERCPVDTKSL